LENFFLFSLVVSLSVLSHAGRPFQPDWDRPPPPPLGFFFFFFFASATPLDGREVSFFLLSVDPPFSLPPPSSTSAAPLKRCSRDSPWIRDFQPPSAKMSPQASRTLFRGSYALPFVLAFFSSATGWAFFFFSFIWAPLFRRTRTVIPSLPHDYNMSRIFGDEGPFSFIRCSSSPPLHFWAAPPSPPWPTFTAYGL